MHAWPSASWLPRVRSELSQSSATTNPDRTHRIEERCRVEALPHATRTDAGSRSWRLRLRSPLQSAEQRLTCWAACCRVGLRSLRAVLQSTCAAAAAPLQLCEERLPRVAAAGGSLRPLPRSL